MAFGERTTEFPDPTQVNTSQKSRDLPDSGGIARPVACALLDGLRLVHMEGHPMKIGIAKAACTTFGGFSAKIDRLLERRRAKRARPTEPDLPVLTALSGMYRRRSSGPLPVIDQAMRLVRGHDGRDGTRQVFAPPPGRGAVFVMGWRSPERSVPRAGRERRAV